MLPYKERQQHKKAARHYVSIADTTTLKQAHEFVFRLLEFRKVEKRYTTYIKGTKKAIKYNEENKVYCDFKFSGTVTGRLSCGGYSVKKAKKGVSFHTLVNKEDDKTNIRSLYCAPKGWAFLTADYKAMELRILAHIAKEEVMQRAFIRGLDLHTYTAGLIFNKKMENVTKTERKNAKAPSFLTVYGGSEYALARTLKTTVDRARKILDAWAQAYPGVIQYKAFLEEFMKENEYVYSIFGRRRHLPNIKSPSKDVVERCIRQGLNSTIQSPASDVILCAILGIVREFRKKGLKARIVATVHDSIEAVCPQEELKETIKIIHYYMVKNPIMVQVFGISLDVPLAIDLEVGKNFGEGMELVHVDGEIQNYREILEYISV